LKYLVYWLTWITARLAFAVFWRYRVEGLHHLPRNRGFIVAANHRSFAEPALIGCTVPRRNFFFAKRELFAQPLFGLYLRALGAFPVDRGGADLGAIRYALDVLKQGRVLVFFPEGTRSPSDAFLPAQPGIGMIALRAQVPVVPAYVQGSRRARGRLWAPRPVRTRFGPAVDVADSGWTTDREGYQRLADLVLDRIKDIARSMGETVTETSRSTDHE